MKEYPKFYISRGNKYLYRISEDLTLSVTVPSRGTGFEESVWRFKDFDKLCEFFDLKRIPEEEAILLI